MPGTEGLLTEGRGFTAWAAALQGTLRSRLRCGWATPGFSQLSLNLCPTWTVPVTRFSQVGLRGGRGGTWQPQGPPCCEFC